MLRTIPRPHAGAALRPSRTKISARTVRPITHVGQLRTSTTVNAFDMFKNLFPGGSNQGQAQPDRQTPMDMDMEEDEMATMRRIDSDSSEGVDGSERPFGPLVSHACMACTCSPCMGPVLHDPWANPMRSMHGVYAVQHGPEVAATVTLIQAPMCTST